MFKIELVGAGKRYNQDWIFRDLDTTFQSGDSTAILGGNGSGKSTFLRAVTGYTPLSKGSIVYSFNDQIVQQDEAYAYFSYCAPYLELYEELSLDELADFHFSLKKPIEGFEAKRFSEAIGLESASKKAIKYFSSGMKQRVRIGLAVYSDVAVICLDEPTSNLDRKAIEWYRETIETNKKDRIVLVASNKQEDEYFFCTEKINVENYKPS